MIFQLFRPRPRPANIAALYGAIVAQSRRPTFYRDFGVPDTVNGRFEMVMAHTILVVRRLRTAGESGRELGQAVFDRFCADMDGTLREWGVGDLAVPRQMRKVGEAFYGRLAAYDEALAATDDQALGDLLGRVFVEDNAGPDDTAALATYIRQAAQRIERQDELTLARGDPDFPEPEAK